MVVITMSPNYFLTMKILCVDNLIIRLSKSTLCDKV